MSPTHPDPHEIDRWHDDGGPPVPEHDHGESDSSGVGGVAETDRAA